jgi:NAD(P)-dependent dehydrogenase (short-subunit alcohol dehydrogenase family)
MIGNLYGNMLSGPPEAGRGVVMSQIALVTGANRGLGKEVARRLAHRGHTVLLGSRDLRRGVDTAEELAAAGARTTPIRLDVTDPASVGETVAQIRAAHGRLDVLVNNAGTFVGALPLETSMAEMREIFEVNVFSVVEVTRACVPLLRRSAAPRVVNVSSTTASLALTSVGAEIPGDASRRLAYSSSKAALNMLTVQYARAFAQDPALAHVKINSAVPGYTATDMNDHRGTRTVQEGARAIVDLATLPDDGPSGGCFADDGPVPW